MFLDILNHIRVKEYQKQLLTSLKYCKRSVMNKTKLRAGRDINEFSLFLMKSEVYYKYA